MIHIGMRVYNDSLEKIDLALDTGQTTDSQGRFCRSNPWSHNSSFINVGSAAEYFRQNLVGLNVVEAAHQIKLQVAPLKCQHFHRIVSGDDRAVLYESLSAKDLEHLKPGHWHITFKAFL